MDPLTLVREFGPYVAIAILVLERLFPTFREMLSAEHRARIRREEEERKQRAQLELEERKQVAEQNGRLSKALDRFSEQMGAFALALTTVAERQASMERDQEYIRNAMMIVADRMNLSHVYRMSKPEDRIEREHKDGK
jgi:hypothetical protein